ncbi:hypothetical protein J11TS1_24640 [Oceanobacillus sp. J11TS1]|nr:hypothetical protein J11TS1_24640 [Oceanobacillus sp. J11TS1]
MKEHCNTISKKSLYTVLYPVIRVKVINRRKLYMELSEIKQELEKITSRVEEFRGSL